MRYLPLFAIHLFVTIATLLRPGGVRTVAAESLLLEQQLILSNGFRQRAPNLTTLDRFVFGLITGNIHEEFDCYLDKRNHTPIHAMYSDLTATSLGSNNCGVQTAGPERHRNADANDG